MAKILPPTAYQGGKQRLAETILDLIKPRLDSQFYDLCCGSGAISLELVSQGHDPAKITMLDKGPWGIFWQTIGDGSFNVGKFEQVCSDLPQDRSKIKQYIENLSKQPAHIDGNCGYVNDGLTLADREWVCPRCSVKHDRDVNAAKNILRQGLNQENRTVGTTEIADCLGVRPVGY